jgi:hypothetical protein
VVLAVWVVLILHNLIVQMFAVEHIAYSEFMRALNEGRVVEVSIGDRLKALLEGNRQTQA